MKRFAGLGCLLALLLAAGNAQAAAEHQCAADARTHAKALLAFHFGPDDRMEIDPAVKVLSPIKNPAGKGHFDVLEVWGNIYKGQYRMHFIYALVGGDCLLMGQEILEYGDPF